MCGNNFGELKGCKREVVSSNFCLTEIPVRCTRGVSGVPELEACEKVGGSTSAVTEHMEQ